MVGCRLGRLCCVEKRKDKGLARVLGGVLPLHCHLPRLGCLFLRHQHQACQRMRDDVASSQVFWEAWLSVVCSVFVQLSVVECDASALKVVSQFHVGLKILQAIFEKVDI